MDDGDKTIFSPPKKDDKTKAHDDDVTRWVVPSTQRAENDHISPRPFKRARKVRDAKNNQDQANQFFSSGDASASHSHKTDLFTREANAGQNSRQHQGHSQEYSPEYSQRHNQGHNQGHGQEYNQQYAQQYGDQAQWQQEQRQQEQWQQEQWQQVQREQKEKQEQTGFFARKPPPKTHRVKRNLLLDEASNLLVMAGQLRLSSSPQQIDVLRQDIIEKITLYIATIEPHYPEKQVANAGICLCSLIDQNILKTSWGKESGWGRESILAELYHTAQTKELMGIIRDELASYNPTIDILELYYTCLRMDFKSISDDDNLVQELTHALYEKIRHASLDEQAPLSHHLLSASSKPIKQLWSVLLWVVPACSIAVLALTYIIFSHLLNDSFQSVQVHLDSVGDETPRLAVKHFQAVVDEAKPKNTQLMQILHAEYSSGMIELFDGEPGTRILIRTDELFASGSAYVEPDFYPLIQKIATALNGTEGDILVQGHTDNVPFRTGVNTNQRLSDDRAQAFGELLAETLVIPARLRWQGYAERKPFVCNTSAALRAKNRRVEIVLPATEIDGLDKLLTPVCSQ